MHRQIKTEKKKKKTFIKITVLRGRSQETNTNLMVILKTMIIIICSMNDRQYGPKCFAPKAYLHQIKCETEIMNSFMVLW